jgi:hypothetical protein
MILNQHADRLPVCWKIELAALAWDRHFLSTVETLGRLFDITITGQLFSDGGRSLEIVDANLHEALVSWDSQEDLDVIKPELEMKIRAVLRRYISSASDIAQLLFTRLQ